jgi:hypothetical protein
MPLWILMIAASVCRAAGADHGIAWPEKNSWPRAGDPLFIAANALAVEVGRDDLNQAPADQLSCPRDSEVCVYTFRPCQQVWARKTDQKKGFVLIDVAHLRSAKIVGGSWWLLLATTESECQAEISGDSGQPVKTTPWSGTGPIARDGWKVLAH